MASRKRGNYNPTGLIVLMGVQALCALFFLDDVIGDVRVLGVQALAGSHLMIESLATLALFIGIGLEAHLLSQLLRRQGQVERALSAASGALNDLIRDYYREWGLTPSEEDVATFTFKGYSIAEIATFRGSREGTIKAHLNAIYRKAGVSGRGQLVSVLIEDLMRGDVGGTGESANAGG